MMDDRQRRRAEFVTKLVLGIVATLSASGLAFAIWTAAQPDAFDPITYPPQRVVSLDPQGVESIPFVAGFEFVPAVRLADGKVPVSGQTCSTASTPVDVIASIWWERLEPQGRRIQVLADFPTIVDPGCASWHVINDIPPELSDITTAEQWHIIGKVTPTADGGVTSTWITETFWIVP